MKIKLKQNIDGIMALNSICEMIVNDQTPTIGARVTRSVFEDIHKLVKKHLEKAMQEHDIFNVKKKYTIVLKLHEAYAIHEGTMTFIETFGNPLTKTKLNQIKDFLNRQIT